MVLQRPIMRQQLGVTTLMLGAGKFAEAVLFEGNELDVCSRVATGTSSSCLSLRMFMASKIMRWLTAPFRWLAPEIPKELVRRFVAEQLIGLFCFIICIICSVTMELAMLFIRDRYNIYSLRFASALLTAFGVVLLLYFVISGGIVFIRDVRRHYRNSSGNQATGVSK